MSKHATPAGARPRTRTIVAASFGVGALALTGAGIYAGLQATATGATSVTTGTLSLTLGNETGSTGFPTTISNMVPGDSHNTYVNLTNGGTLAGKTLSFAVATAASNTLTTDATNGLHVTVTSCAVAWVAATCVSPTTVVNNVPLSTLKTTPQALAAAPAAGAVYHYKVTTSLPDQNETVLNGSFPAGTIQGLTAGLTYTFNELQPDAATTDH